MVRLRQMSVLSKRLTAMAAGISFPDDVTLTIDIDPADLG